VYGRFSVAAVVSGCFSRFFIFFSHFGRLKNSKHESPVSQSRHNFILLTKFTFDVVVGPAPSKSRVEAAFREFLAKHNVIARKMPEFSRFASSECAFEQSMLPGSRFTDLTPMPDHERDGRPWTPASLDPQALVWIHLIKSAG